MIALTAVTGRGGCYGCDSCYGSEGHSIRVVPAVIIVMADTAVMVMMVVTAMMVVMFAVAVMVVMLATAVIIATSVTVGKCSRSRRRAEKVDKRM
jgi:hypothetical protein